MSFYLISFCILQGTKYGTFHIDCIQNTAETFYLLSYFSQNLNSYLIMRNAKINILKYKCITCLLAKIRSKASRSSFSVNNFASSLCASLTLSLWLLSTTNTTAIKKNQKYTFSHLFNFSKWAKYFNVILWWVYHHYFHRKAAYYRSTRQ